MKCLITDTNVFFDIICIGVLPEFFALDYEISTTDFVIKEILESDQRAQIESFIRAHKLIVYKLTAEEVEEIRNFDTKRFFKGITDKTVLWKSQQLKSMLLTGDKKLRNEAEEMKIPVHGSIWVINELVEKKIISMAKGTELLDKLKLLNACLPAGEIDDLKERFGEHELR